MLKNIVIVNDFAKADGGAGKVAIDVAIALSEKYNVFFFSSVLPIEIRLQKSRVNVVCVGKPDILADKNRYRAVLRGLWDSHVKNEFTHLLSGLNNKETIVHVHTWTKALSSAVFSVTAKMNFHLVLTLHDFFAFCPNGGFFNYTKKQICIKKGLSLSCIFTNCDTRSFPQKMWRVLRMCIQDKTLWSNKHLTLLYISEMSYKVVMPYIPHNIKALYLPDPVELVNKEKADVSRNDCYLYLGRLSPEKGVNLFCEALAGLGLKGILVGDGYIRQELMTKYPQMNFAGWASGERKKELMLSAKALIFPSFWMETYGLVVAEARSYGIPCIVPDQCAASEQIVNGSTGYIFKTGNLESLKEAIMKYEKSDIAQMQKNLIESFNPKDLSMETHLKRLLDIYNEILDGK